MAAVRPGYYLLDHPPARRQGRYPRRAPVKPVVVVHTAESGTDPSGADPKAERVADFIRRRSDPGNYHLLGDADSIIQMLPMSWEVWHDATGSNRWSIGISLAMNAADWTAGRLSLGRRAQLLDTAGQMSAIAGRWLQEHGHGAPAARLLTKAESDRPGASGFISHARRDPARRTDPGRNFPWNDFFDRYHHHLKELSMPTITVPDPHMQQIQTALTGAGYDPGPVDGIPGPRTAGAVDKALADVDRLTEANTDYRATIEEQRAAMDAQRDRIAELEADLSELEADEDTVAKAKSFDEWQQAVAVDTRYRHQAMR